MSDVNVSRGSVSSRQVRCEKCGSTYFVEAQFRQYRTMPSSMPGGDLSPVTEDPIRMLVCMCGNPIPPGKLRKFSIPREQADNFDRSLNAARQFREVADPQAMMGRLSETFASREAHDRLAEQIANPAGILRDLLLKPVSPPDATTPREL